MDNFADNKGNESDIPTPAQCHLATVPTTFLPTAPPSEDGPVAGPAAARAAGPAFNDHATTILSVARRNISTIAGPAAHVPPPRLSITTLPATRATAAEKDKAWNLPGDGPETPPIYKPQRIGPRMVEVIDIPSDEDDNMPSASMRVSNMFDDRLIPGTIAGYTTDIILPTRLPITIQSDAGPVAGSVARHAIAHIRPTCQPTTTPVPAVCAKTKKISPHPPGARLPLLLAADLPVGHHFAAQKRKSQALSNEVPESSQAFERRIINSQNSNAGATSSLSHIIFDYLGEEVTSGCLLVILGPFPYVDFDFVLEVYLQIYGRQLMAKGDKPQSFIRALARLEGLEHWVPQHEGLGLGQSCKCKPTTSY
ncbi:hypothetical protein GGI17_006478 [Coemansia sp. S146]|nr:hypothetical protein GGI17_006478 [Coemansia sp. S146]